MNECKLFSKLSGYISLNPAFKIPSFSGELYFSSFIADLLITVSNACVILSSLKSDVLSASTCVCF